MNSRTKPNWDKPLRIVTNRGTFKVNFIGKDILIGKPVVKICHIGCSTYPDYYTPDENGYVVEFDSWVENIPSEQYISIKILNWEKEYGHVNINDTPEGLEVWIGGEFRYRQKRT